MKQVLMTVLALLVLFGSFSVQSASLAGSAVDNSDSPDNFNAPFYGMEKKWSRREPSIRFVKRGQYIPNNYDWDQ